MESVLSRAIHGPVVYPRSPEEETSAKPGDQDNAIEGTGWVRNHSWPLTGCGRKMMASSERNAMKAESIPFSAEVRAKARSALTSDVTSSVVVSSCAAAVMAHRRTMAEKIVEGVCIPEGMEKKWKRESATDRRKRENAPAGPLWCAVPHTLQSEPRSVPGAERGDAGNAFRSRA